MFFPLPDFVVFLVGVLFDLGALFVLRPRCVMRSAARQLGRGAGPEPTGNTYLLAVHLC